MQEVEPQKAIFGQLPLGPVLMPPLPKGSKIRILVPESHVSASLTSTCMILSIPEVPGIGEIANPGV